MKSKKIKKFEFVLAPSKPIKLTKEDKGVWRRIKTWKEEDFENKLGADLIKFCKDLNKTKQYYNNLFILNKERARIKNSLEALEQIKSILREELTFESDVRELTDPIKNQLEKYKAVEDELDLSIIDFFKALEELPKEDEKWNTLYINYKGRVYLIKEQKELER